MEGKKKITVCFLVLVFMMGTCFRIPVQAAGLEKQSNINVAQIKTSKKTQRTGKKFSCTDIVSVRCTSGKSKNRVCWQWSENI